MLSTGFMRELIGSSVEKTIIKPWWLQPDNSIEVWQRATTALLYEEKQCKQTTITGWFSKRP